MSAALCSCSSAGCTGCLPEDLPHLSPPKNWVLPLQLSSGVEKSLGDKERREILGVLGGYRCDVRHIQSLLSSKASYQEEVTGTELVLLNSHNPFDASDQCRADMVDGV